MSHLPNIIQLSYVFGSLIAAGILKMRGVCGKPGWFWLFVLEGGLTFLVGLVVGQRQKQTGKISKLIRPQSFLYVPVSPTHTWSFLHTKSWYTEREEIIVVNRVLRDDAAKGHTANNMMPKLNDIWTTLKDKTLWLFYLIGFMGVLSYMPVKIYLPLALRRLGFSTFKSNMLTIPCAALQLVTVTLWAWSSKRYDERTWHCLVAHALAIPSLIALEFMKPGVGIWERYACLVTILGCE